MYSAIHDIDDEPNVKDGERMLLLCVYLPVIIGVTSGVGYFHNYQNKQRQQFPYRAETSSCSNTAYKNDCGIFASHGGGLAPFASFVLFPFSPSSIAISVGLFSTARVDFGEKTAIALTAQPFGDCILILTFVVMYMGCIDTDLIYFWTGVM
ncbi:hypothetical protein HanXRQr2_Chr03g0091591 [Helianthus annuus]|uniref:Uncharacterized protein n=2 Tax=Helianthus annuus TaxID=4232 RepID=A0A9K3JC88_HELAN|nr:hypothetical protein HanXRQr2_Chr03g0091591 [Helianthus annuus]